MSTLVGFKHFTSKKGVSYCVANVVSSYNDREIQNDCVGSKVEEVFLPEEQKDYLKPSDIGKKVNLDYEISGGRAYLLRLEVVRDK